jgi:hypothetical protein
LHQRGFAASPGSKDAQRQGCLRVWRQDEVDQGIYVRIKVKIISFRGLVRNESSTLVLVRHWRSLAHSIPDSHS